MSRAAWIVVGATAIVGYLMIYAQFREWGMSWPAAAASLIGVMALIFLIPEVPNAWFNFQMRRAMRESRRRRA